MWSLTTSSKIEQCFNEWLPSSYALVHTGAAIHTPKNSIPLIYRYSYHVPAKTVKDKTARKKTWMKTMQV